ncbi:GTP cyclohydrolase II [Fimbriiglobus ruber]|uniref:GTP cyclohydrolase II n=1 Tax=Fimbriiglobus ruber TaxID=1908690 RepID=A0A225DWF9_9BACT|nr:GTP cyclohydrolase II [Fimbriiglobus ruber]
MLDALRAKFSQHEEMKAALLGTGDAKLVEHTANDDYWGDGGDGSGKNRLGQLLMRVRDELRAEVG